MRPTLRLAYADRYRLWQELVREAELHQGRVFVASDEILEPGAQVVVDVAVEAPPLRVALAAVVEARRPASLRFSRGLFVRLADGELARVHEALGLLPQADDVARGRQGRRFPLRWPVRFRTPALPQVLYTDDISAAGLQVEMPEKVRTGHVLELFLETPQGHQLLFAGTVMWTSERHRRIGLELRFESDAGAELFRRLVEMAAALSPAAPREAPPRLRTVLVADDDEEALTIARLALDGLARVVSAANGEEALTRIRADRPDVVVLDILMPHLDGGTVCKALRADVELCEVPVIFISALDEPELGRHAAEAGASDWMPKPFSPRQLRGLVERYLGEG